MPINALARTIVNKVLHVLDRHTFAAIPDADILEAYSVVAHLLRAECGAPLDLDTEDIHP